ncbi:MAG: hypothetical protein ACYTFA_07435 [Planctomycetota bacterium]
MLVGASGTLILDRPAETPTQRVYNERRPCGLTDVEVDELMDDYRHSTVSREESIELFKSTFTNDEHGPEGCLMCVGAVLDAAAVPGPHYGTFPKRGGLFRGSRHGLHGWASGSPA